MPSSWGFGSLQITETHDSDKISPHEFENKLISHAPITTTFLVEIGRRRSSRFILCVTLRGAHFTAFCPIPSQGRRGRTKLGNSGRGKGGNGFISGAWSRATKLHFFLSPFRIRKSYFVTEKLQNNARPDIIHFVINWGLQRSMLLRLSPPSTRPSKIDIGF